MKCDYNFHLFIFSLTIIRKRKDFHSKKKKKNLKGNKFSQKSLKKHKHRTLWYIESDNHINKTQPFFNCGLMFYCELRNWKYILFHVLYWLEMFNHQIVVWMGYRWNMSMPEGIKCIKEHFWTCDNIEPDCTWLNYSTWVSMSPLKSLSFRHGFHWVLLGHGADLLLALMIFSYPFILRYHDPNE